MCLAAFWIDASKLLDREKMIFKNYFFQTGYTTNVFFFCIIYTYAAHKDSIFQNAGYNDPQTRLLNVPCRE